MTRKNVSLFRQAALAISLGLLAVTGMAAQTTDAASTPAKSSKSGKSGSSTKSAKPAATAKTPEPATAEKLVLEPRAIELLKVSAARLAAAKSMSFTATAGYEYPSQLGPAILYTLRYDVTMQRPNKLKVIMPGDGPISEFYYDGKTMTAYSPVEHLAAVADAPSTIDSMLKQAYELAGIYYPFTDLIVADPDAALVEGTKLAFYIGTSNHVGGTKTDMVAWSDDNVFIQMWIGVDDKLPRRIRAVYSADPMRMRHEVDFANWQLDTPVAEGAFTSAVAQSAPHMAFSNPVGPLPAGVKPITEQTPTEAKPAPSAKSSKDSKASKGSSKATTPGKSQ